MESVLFSEPLHHNADTMVTLKLSDLRERSSPVQHGKPISFEFWTNKRRGWQKKKQERLTDHSVKKIGPEIKLLCYQAAGIEPECQQLMNRYTIHGWNRMRLPVIECRSSPWVEGLPVLVWVGKERSI